MGEAEIEKSYNTKADWHIINNEGFDRLNLSHNTNYLFLLNQHLLLKKRF
jgi:hypothetical protein